MLLPEKLLCFVLMGAVLITVFGVSPAIGSPSEGLGDGAPVETVNPASEISPMSIIFFTYSETFGADSFRFTLSQAVTPWVHGGAGGATISFGQSQTFSSSWQLGLTADQINAVVGGLGINYSRTASSSTSFAVTFVVSPNTIGRVRFAPTLRYSSGNLLTWRQGNQELNPRIISTRPTVNDVIRRVGAWADGLHYLETSP